MHVHKTIIASVKTEEVTIDNVTANRLVVDVTNGLEGSDLCTTAPIYVVEVESDGSIKPVKPLTVTNVIAPTEQNPTTKLVLATTTSADITKVLVDCYVIKSAAKVTELAIDAEHFAGYYYVEASTLFRKEETGKDLPAEITIPKVKIQSNFTFTMSSTGDPSTFTFTMDAFPGYTYFNPNDKVLMVMQIVDDEVSGAAYGGPYMLHEDNETNKYGESGGVPADVDSYNTTP